MAGEKIFFIAFILFLLIGLIISILNDPYIRRRHKKTLLLIIGLCISLILQNYIEDTLAAGQTRWLARTISSIYGYAVRPAIIVLVYSILAPKKRFLPAWILVGINALVHMTALFSQLCFWIDDTNHWHGGPLRYCCLNVSIVLLIYMLYLSVHEHRHEHILETIIPILTVVMILVSIWMDGQATDSRQPIAYLTVAMSFSCVFYYIWLHLKFVQDHEEDLKAQQRIKIMMSQIQPHFLYNTLSTIQVLCHTDPEKAAEVTGNFSSYLRRNLSSLDEPGLIPFEKELEHTKAYVQIEETRFPNIHVQYDIRDSDFSLPPLTLQPMVENAIRHGVRIRDEGIIDVISLQLGGCHEVLIRDNGVGFDAEAVKAAGRSHVGLRNVQSRIESMCGGTMLIDSRVGEGTTVIIRIPLRKENQEGKI
ncbi:MAG: histidine kinase [Clostridiales bacterium]|nr:histidine kinase [Clostridiales bacterium]